jgi:hypothetical protein
MRAARVAHRLGRRRGASAPPRRAADMRAAAPRVWGHCAGVHTGSPSEGDAVSPATPRDADVTNFHDERRASAARWRALFEHLDRDGDGKIAQGDANMLIQKLNLGLSPAATTAYSDLSRELDFDEFRRQCTQGAGDSEGTGAAGVEGGAATEEKGIQRFQDYHGSWHEAAQDLNEISVYEDVEISSQMRFWLVTAKGAGSVLWLSTYGTLLSLWPAGLVGGGAVCGVTALATAGTATYWACLKLRRELERNIYKVSIPGPVAASMAKTEQDMDSREKDHVAGIYNWVLLESRCAPTPP